MILTCRTTRALVAISPSWSGLVKAMPTPTPAMRIMINIINVTLVIIKAMPTPIPAMRIMINIINVTVVIITFSIVLTHQWVTQHRRQSCIELPPKVSAENIHHMMIKDKDSL